MAVVFDDVGWYRAASNGSHLLGLVQLGSLPCKLTIRIRWRSSGDGIVVIIIILFWFKSMALGPSVVRKMDSGSELYVFMKDYGDSPHFSHRMLPKMVFSSYSSCTICVY